MKVEKLILANSKREPPRDLKDLNLLKKKNSVEE